MLWKKLLTLPIKTDFPHTNAVSDVLWIVEVSQDQEPAVEKDSKAIPYTNMIKHATCILLFLEGWRALEVSTFVSNDSSCDGCKQGFESWRPRFCKEMLESKRLARRSCTLPLVPRCSPPSPRSESQQRIWLRIRRDLPSFALLGSPRPQHILLIARRAWVVGPLMRQKAGRLHGWRTNISLPFHHVSQIGDLDLSFFSAYRALSN